MLAIYRLPITIHIHIHTELCVLYESRIKRENNPKTIFMY